MGYLKHHSLIVTSPFKKDIDKAHAIAMYIFKQLNDEYHGKNENLVTDIHEGIVNTQYTFFVVPDGSKEGWPQSNDCNKLRAEFLAWMHGNDTGCDYVEICFGGDNDSCEITNKN